MVPTFKTVVSKKIMMMMLMIFQAKVCAQQTRYYFASVNAYFSRKMDTHTYTHTHFFKTTLLNHP